MAGIKLLAIRPLKGCDSSFNRVLKLGELYRFYQDYEFEFGSKDPFSNVLAIVYRKTVPEDLFDQDQLKINVSAVVGKNGGGKSTIMELFFAVVHVLSAHFGLFEDDLQTIPAEIKRVKKSLKNDHHKLRTFFKETSEEVYREEWSRSSADTLVEGFSRLQKQVERIDKNLKWKDKRLTELEAIQEEIYRLNRYLKVELFYEVEDKIYCLQVGKGARAKKRLTLNCFEGTKTGPGRFEFSDSDDHRIPFDFEHFFYSIAVSYSHYALNSREVGPWINALFHKNDGYQTPLVITPWREEGNININRENLLVKQRLLSVLLEPIGSSNPAHSLRNLADGKTAESLVLKFDYDKIEKQGSKAEHVENGVEVLQKLYHRYTGIRLAASVPPEPMLVAAQEYIILKLIRICTKYPGYHEFLQGNEFVASSIDRFVAKLVADRSHVTFKVKQAINFLRFKLFMDWEAQNETTIGLSTFSQYIQDCRKRLQSDSGRQNILTIELIPPLDL